MKVYVVTTGKRADYHILCVTLDKKVAEDYVNAINKARRRYKKTYGEIYKEDFRLEEYDTDNFKHVVAGHVPYLVELYEDGEHYVFRNDNNHSGIGAVSEYGANAHRAKVYAYCEHNAIEIASKKVAEYKARKEGIT